MAKILYLESEIHMWSLYIFLGLNLVQFKPEKYPKLESTLHILCLAVYY